MKLNLTTQDILIKTDKMQVIVSAAAAKRFCFCDYCYSDGQVIIDEAIVVALIGAATVTLIVGTSIE